MGLHRNARLGLAGRLALLRSVEEGLSLKAAAAAFNVAPTTVCRWSGRWRLASDSAQTPIPSRTAPCSLPGFRHAATRLLPSRRADEELVRRLSRRQWGHEL